MTRDYKNTRSREPARASGWLCFCAGLAVGLGVAAMVYLNNGTGRTDSAPPIGFRPDAASPKEPRDVRSAAPKPIPEHRDRFDFYTLLPELEVVVPGSGGSAEHDRSAQTAPSEPPATGGYVLQAGSFRKYAEADRLKARLALMGVQADIHSVKVNEEAWYRVRIGPYSDRARIDSISAKLADKAIDTLLLRVRK